VINDDDNHACNQIFSGGSTAAKVDKKWGLRTGWGRAPSPEKKFTFKMMHLYAFRCLFSIRFLLFFFLTSLKCIKRTPVRWCLVWYLHFCRSSTFIHSWMQRAICI